MSYSKKDIDIWICDLTYTQQTIASDAFPMAVGCLATYAEKTLPWLKKIKIFKYPQKLCDEIEKNGYPNLLCFANYVWNFNLSYEIAKYVKKKSPKTVIIFGGPNYPVVENEQSEFLKKNKAIDFYIAKEGEIPFSKLIENLVNFKFDIDLVKKQNLPSVHCVLKNGKVLISNASERIKNLSEIPSPYLDGRLDEFFDGSLMPLIQTNRGCPFSCTFCVEGDRYYNKINYNCQEKVSKELDYIGKKMQSIRKKGGRNDLFIADSNFGMYKEDIFVAKELAKTQEKYGWPEYINVATGKNVKHRILETSKIVGGALRLSGSVQSLDPKVQENIKRKNISAEGLMDLALSASEIGANSYSEIILGLPGDSKKAHFNTVKTVIEAGFNNIFLFQLMLLPGSEMSTKESVDKYGMKIKYRVLPRCYGSFKINNDKIISAEIEQICVSLNTLSYKDYLSCRFMHFMVTIFYNDGIFSSLLKYMKLNKLPIWRWVEILMDLKKGTKLQKVIDEFIEATKNELWENSSELSNYIKEDGVVEKYIDGRLGNNLLFTYKSMAITNSIDDLATLAKQATIKVLEENNLDKTDNLNFINDCIKYHQHSIKNIFYDFDKVSKDKFVFDIKKFIFDKDSKTNNLSDMNIFKFDKNEELEFILSNEQKKLINNFINIYGSNKVGIARILSKVYVKKLFRSGVLLGSGEKINTQNLTEKTVSITGLQN